MLLPSPAHLARALTVMIAAAVVLTMAMPPALARITVTGAPSAPGTTRVTFTIDEGCAGSPTTSVRVHLPPGTSGVLPDPLPGWQVSATDEAIVWEGGSAPAEGPATFSASVRLPGMAGDNVVLPTVQRCAAGQRSWTDADPSAPTAAPRLELVVSHQPRRPPGTAPPRATIPERVPPPSPPVTASPSITGRSRTMVGGTAFGAAMLVAITAALLAHRRHRRRASP